MDQKQESNWAMGSHLAALAGFIIPFGNIIGPLVIWLTKKEESAKIDTEAKKSLNFQISVTIYYLISFVLMFIVIGVPLMIALAIFSLVMIILNGVKASKGEETKYPLSLKLIK